MGFRDTLNKNQGLVFAAVVLAVGIAVYVLAFAGPKQSGVFYSTDDGESWFEHEAVMPPFDHRGGEAVQAMVFTCDGGATKFVGYLMKYQDEATRAAAQEALESRTRLPQAGLLVKRPGDAEWVPVGAAAGEMAPARAAEAMAGGAIVGGGGDDAQARLGAAEIKNVRCPQGTPGPLITVTPASE